jgi:mandelate racemase
MSVFTSQGTRRSDRYAMSERLTLKSAAVRSVLVPLRRPIVSKVGLFREWPLILIDLYTNEGVVGRSYLEPYLKQSPRYIIPAIEDLVTLQIGKRLAPIDNFQANRRSLNLVGYEGIAMIAVAGIDMAIWDALAKAAGMPLAVMLGGSLGDVSAYNSNGLWLTDVSTLAKEAKELVAEGQFEGLKLRLGRDRLADDLAAIRAVREGAGDEIKLMVDFNQGLSLGDALARCHALDDAGLYWFEEPIVYNNLSGYAQLARELQTPVQIGENFYGPRAIHDALAAGACDYVMPDLMRIGGVSGWLRAAPVAAAAGIQVSTHLYPEVAAHLMRVTETAHWLEWQDWADPILKEAFVVKNGKIEIPDRPGSGIDWDEGAVKRYAN